MLDGCRGQPGGELPIACLRTASMARAACGQGRSPIAILSCREEACRQSKEMVKKLQPSMKPHIILQQELAFLAKRKAPKEQHNTACSSCSGLTPMGCLLPAEAPIRSLPLERRVPAPNLEVAMWGRCAWQCVCNVLSKQFHAPAPDSIRQHLTTPLLARHTFAKAFIQCMQSLHTLVRGLWLYAPSLFCDAGMGGKFFKWIILKVRFLHTIRHRS
jgi:hypothetical protein